MPRPFIPVAVGGDMQNKVIGIIDGITKGNAFIIISFNVLGIFSFFAFLISILFDNLPDYLLYLSIQF